MTSSECHSIKILITIVGYSLVSMVTYLGCHPTYYLEEHGIQCHTSEMLPEMNTMENLIFPFQIQSQII